MYKFDTLLIHAGYSPDPATGAVVPPIYQTTAYQFADTADAAAQFSLQSPGSIYTRLANPTNSVLEERIAALDGGAAAVAFSSGHAAMFSSILNLCSAGDEFVSSICIYGGAVNMFGVTLKNLGITCRFVDPDDLSAWENAVTDKTRAFFVETVGNPNANVADLSAIAEIAHRHGIPLIVDSTFTTPALCRPIEFGADIVIHSATKYLGGHGNSMCGLAVDSGKFPFKGNPRFPAYNSPDPSYHGVVFADMDAPFAVRLRALMLRDLGACVSPFNAFLILNGMETLSLRMERHSSNARAVAEYLSAHPDVAFVHCPMLPQDRYYALAQKYCPRGAGSVFTFGLRGDRQTCARFIDALRLFSHVANVGDARSLVIHPGTTTHSQLSDEQLAASGITPTTIRLSIGLEDISDIIADLEQAIRASRL